MNPSLIVGMNKNQDHSLWIIKKNNSIPNLFFKTTNSSQTQHITPTQPSPVPTYPTIQWYPSSRVRTSQSSPYTQLINQPMNQSINSFSLFHFYFPQSSFSYPQHITPLTKSILLILIVSTLNLISHLSLINLSSEIPEPTTISFTIILSRHRWPLKSILAPYLHSIIDSTIPIYSK